MTRGGVDMASGQAAPILSRHYGGRRRGLVCRPDGGTGTG
jgi:hypothetical protein